MIIPEYLENMNESEFQNYLKDFIRKNFSQEEISKVRHRWVTV